VYGALVALVPVGPATLSIGLAVTGEGRAGRVGSGWFWAETSAPTRGMMTTKMPTKTPSQ
jgi:hypothetical protein